MRFLIFFISLSLSAQTVYVRTNGTSPFIITGSTHGNPPTITTLEGHGLSVGKIVGNWGVCTGAPIDPASAKTPVNGLHKVLSTPSLTTFTISDGPASNTPDNDPNDYIFCSSEMYGFGPSNGQWGGEYTAVSLPPGPVGWLDGQNGTITRKLALGTANGLASSAGVVVSGCPGACVVTITTTYSHGVLAGDKFSVNGTGGAGSSALNQAGTSNKQTPYTVASATSTTFTSAVVAGLTNGDYTNSNNTCGPNSTPNDTNTGTNNCVRISQLAYIGNTMWDQLIVFANGLYGPGNTTHYLFPKDNPTSGNITQQIAYGTANQYALAAYRWFVDPSDTTSFNVAAYFYKNVEQSFGVSWPCIGDIGFQACGVPGGGLQGDQDEIWIGLSAISSIIADSMSVATNQTFAAKMYNDTNYPGSTVTTVNTDWSQDHVNKVLAMGRAQTGTSTSVTLALSDSAGANFYVHNAVQLVYQTSVTNWAVSSNSITVTTASNWGYGANIPIAAGTNKPLVSFSGVSGCPYLATALEWPVTTPIDATHFRVDVTPGVACTPTGGTVTSHMLSCPTAGIPHVTDAQPYNVCSGIITAYNSTTKVATIAGGFGGDSGITVTPEMTYKIYQTISISSTGSNTTATVTGYNTHFTTDVLVGDAVIGASGFVTMCAGKPWVSGSYVTTITDDTHLAVLNQDCTSATSTPSILWYNHSWQPGDTGFKWYGDHWQGAVGAQSVKGPPTGGAGTYCPSGMCPGANNGLLYGLSRTGLGMALAPYSSLAITDLAMMESYSLDYEFAHYINYITGQAHSGATYSMGVIYATGIMASRLFPQIPGFPAISNEWAKNTALYKIYSLLPDINWNVALAGDATIRPTPMAYGTEDGQGSISAGSASAQAYGLDPIFEICPLCDEAKYLAYLIGPSQWNFWPEAASRPGIYFQPIALTHNDPRSLAAASSYFGLPLQRIFLKSAAATCQSAVGNSGNSCPNALNGTSMISRTGWSDLTTHAAARSSTLTYFGMQAFANDHALPQCGATWIFKVGQLVGIDGTANIASSGDGNDQSSNGDIPRLGATGRTLNFGTFNANQNGLIPYGYCPTTQWASQNHGSLNPQYGDQNSRYAYACADLTNSYTPGTMNWGRRCVADLKNTNLNGGGPNTSEQIIVQGTFIDTSTTPTSVSSHLHYPQNGQSYDGSETVGYSYNEGNTTCPGSGGCANLNTNRVIQSLEDNGSDAYNPTRQYGVITKVFSPGTITVADDSFPVTVSSVAKGNPTVFTATANGVKASFTISTMGTPPAPFTFPTFLQIVTTGANNFVYSVNQTDYSFVTIRDSPCTQLNGKTFQVRGTHATVGAIPANGLVIPPVDLGVDVTGCNGDTGGSVYNYPEANVKILGATGDWAAINSNYNNGGSPGGFEQHCPACLAATGGVLPMTYIDPDHFSIPVDSTAFSGSFDGTVYAAYPGALGYSHRVSIHGGAVPGGPVSSYETVVVHKIAQNLTDTTLTAIQIPALIGDPNWVGIQTTDKVILMSRGQNPQPAITSFTTTHSGTAQYLFGNVAAGSWAVTVGGTPVTGSPFAVPNGDNSIYFESTAGVVVATPTLYGFSATDSSPLPGGSVGSSYSQQLHSTGGTGSVTWSLAPTSTPIPATMSVSSGGLVSGISQAVQASSPTFMAIDSSTPAKLAFENLAVSFTNGPQLTASPTSLTYSCTAGGSAGSQNVAIGATGVTLDNWSATKGQTWLTLSPTSGSAAGTMAASVSCAGLTAGSYSDTIAIASTTSGITNSPLHVTVTLTVSAGTTVGTGTRGAAMNGVVIH